MMSKIKICYRCGSPLCTKGKQFASYRADSAYVSYWELLRNLLPICDKKDYK